MEWPYPRFFHGETKFGQRRLEPSRRRFAVRAGHLLAAAAALVLAACAAPSSVRVDLPPPAGAYGPVRMVDERGLLDTRQAAGVQRRLAGNGDSDLVAHHLAHIESAVKAPLALGNEARLLIDGPQTHEAMFEAIARARRHINLETYILEADDPGRRLADLLEKKRAEGVTVNVLYDGVGSIATPREYFQELAAAGISVCEFNPVNPLKAEGNWRINNRDHRKILIVDGETAFTGGINISAVYRSSSFARKFRRPTPKEGWRDTHVEVSGPVVEEFQRLFLDTWEKQGCTPILQKTAYFPRQERRGDKPMRLVAADPGAGQSEFYVVLLSAINQAASRAWLTYGYFVPDQRMIDALRAAARRGVDVRLVLPGFSDFWAPFHAGRSRYGKLLADGVRIFERRDALLHAKTAVIDGVWASIGSTNLDWRSFVHNYEADLIILDPTFAGEMEGLFRLDENASHEVRLAEWQRRGLLLRLKEWVALWWEYLL
ncbi:MAG TPA: phospholipase D-like domain-containing protein [Rhodocyclaceae bacterium]|nr:phospholipase D-like domain-containing protein [Rhodocyclaceae bacterium]